MPLSNWKNQDFHTLAAAALAAAAAWLCLVSFAAAQDPPYYSAADVVVMHGGYEWANTGGSEALHTRRVGCITPPNGLV